MAAIDITGQTFGRLTAIRRVPNKPNRDTAIWLFQCSCGALHETRSHLVRSGATQSCGCLKREKTKAGLRRTHGQSETKTFAVWMSMIERCTNQNHSGFYKYGARGIAVCDRWRGSFPNFLADMGERPEGKTLDRRDNDGPYSPENCRWANAKTQARNQRRTVMVEHDGNTLPLRELAERVGLAYRTLWNRYHKGERGASLVRLPYAPHC